MTAASPVGPPPCRIPGCDHLAVWGLLVCREHYSRPTRARTQAAPVQLKLFELPPEGKR